jgi:hypothetical protein
VEAGRRREDTAEPGQAAGRVSQHHLAAGRIGAAGAMEMAGHGAFVEQAGEGALGQRFAVPIDQLSDGAETWRQRARGHEETEAERGRERLRERADVDDPAVVVEEVQRFERSAGEPELAVVVVLDDGGVVGAGPGEQRPAAGQGHDRAERELVRRRHVHEPSLGRQRVHDDALGVDRHADDVGAAQPGEVAESWVARILDGDDVAGPDQRGQHEVERLLGAGGDDDPVRRRTDAAGALDPRREGVS